MGLDMYLTKKTYVGAEYKHRNVKGNIKLSIEDKKIPINFNQIQYIEESAGYWRKANHIHNWFVKNVQGGNDDCKKYDVTKKDLQKLLENCEAVYHGNDSKKELLPMVEGFFFGSTNYDEFYTETTKDTIDICKKLIDEIDNNTEIFYQSSW